MSTLRSLSYPLLCALAAFSLCSCESLPSGTPPPGEIIKEVAGVKALPSPDKAVNEMATGLTMKLITLQLKSHPAAMALTTESTADSGLGEELMKSLVKSKVAKQVQESPELSLDSALDLKTGVWTVKLLSSDARPLWLRTLALDVRTLQAAQ